MAVSEATSVVKRLVNEIKTPQELVHIRHNITLRQYKYWLMMLNVCHAVKPLQRSGNRDMWLDIPYADIEKAFKYKVCRKEIEHDLEALRMSSIVYNMLSKDGDEIRLGSGFISQWRYSSSALGFLLPDFLIELVERVDMNHAIFQRINMMIFWSFNSKYEAFLYKLCRDYIGTGRTPLLTLAQYRDYMGIVKGEYEEFKELNRNAIAGPIRRINESSESDIEVDLEFKKINKRVVAVQFLVKARQSTLSFSSKNPFTACQIPISRYLQAKYLEGRTVEEVARSIERANQYIDQQRQTTTIASLGAVYRAAIQGNWGAELASQTPSIGEKNPHPQSTSNPADQTTQAAVARREEHESSLRRSYRRSLETKALLAMPLDVKLQYLADYTDQTNVVLLNVYDPRKDSFTDRLFATKFDLWMRTNHLQVQATEDGFQDWLRSQPSLRDD